MSASEPSTSSDEPSDIIYWEGIPSSCQTIESGSPEGAKPIQATQRVLRKQSQVIDGS